MNEEDDIILPPLSKEEIIKILQECGVDCEDYIPKPITMSKEYGYRCSNCRDTGIIEVYGGPNRVCGCDWKY